MKAYFFKLFFLLLFPSLVSCNFENKKTTLEIADPERHYYPVLCGQELDIIYPIENKGKNPLFIKDIHTSCGCIVVDESSFKVLPAGGKGFLRIKYDSNKNIGYVKHYITIYANLEAGDKQEATFDLNVVPNALYTQDYEELYTENKGKLIDEKALVDGKENNKGYYVDNLSSE